jgi:Zn ribbon nucleic-acid-binding protein
MSHEAEDFTKDFEVMCPNCDSQWCIDEIDDQRCYYCGYPNHKEKKKIGMKKMKSTLWKET